jgi:hypothetical protein
MRVLEAAVAVASSRSERACDERTITIAIDRRIKSLGSHAFIQVGDSLVLTRKRSNVSIIIIAKAADPIEIRIDVITTAPVNHQVAVTVTAAIPASIQMTIDSIGMNLGGCVRSWTLLFRSTRREARWVEVQQTKLLVETSAEQTSTRSLWTQI